jgi:hypothetical protein
MLPCSNGHEKCLVVLVSADLTAWHSLLSVAALVETGSDAEAYSDTDAGGDEPQRIASDREQHHCDGSAHDDTDQHA